MKKNIFGKLSMLLALAVMLAGCSPSNEATSENVSTPSPSDSPAPNSDADTTKDDSLNTSTEDDSLNTSTEDDSLNTSTEDDSLNTSTEDDSLDTSTEDDSLNTSLEDSVSDTELYVTFGDNGSPFIMHLYDNDTAAAITRHVGSADLRLPIYNYDGYDNWEVMQYYDIPSRYEIPSNPESVTIENSGEVYYSEPNRIVLFFGDAEVSGEYTPIGYFDSTDEFVNAVKDNPVLEGWGNKIIQISADK